MIWWLIVAAALMLSTALGRKIGAGLLLLGFVVFGLYSLVYVVGCGLRAGGL